MLRRLLTVVLLVLAWVMVVAAAVFLEVRWLWKPRVGRGELPVIERHLVRELQRVTESRRVGAAALVLVENGEIVAAHGFGIADAASGRPVRPEETLFQVASVSKAVTAWGVMRLVEEGKLRLDDPVTRLLGRPPASGRFADRVTIRHLLSHTAGVTTDAGGLVAASEPGTRFAYSGSGYTLLQTIVEEVSGQSFPAYMQESVLQPLGMRGGFGLDQIASRNRTSAVATAYDHAVRPVPHPRRTDLASAGLFATAMDLGQFVRASVGPNEVLRRDTVDAMMRPQPATGGGWGLGYTLFAETPAGLIAGHDGGTVPAWGAMVRLNRRTGNGMALVTSGGSGAINQLGHDWVYWETGVITADARRQILYSRARPAAIVLLAGALLIIAAVMSRPRADRAVR